MEASNGPTDANTPPPTRGSVATKVLWSTILVLLLLNITSLVLMWRHVLPFGCYAHEAELATEPVRDQGPGPLGPPRGAAAFEFIVHETHMDEQQRHSYEQLRDAHQQAVRPVRDSLHSLRETLFKGVSGASAEQSQQILKTIARLVLQQDSITFYHFRAVRALLRTDQQQQFDRVIDEATRMMGSASPPRGPEGRVNFHHPEREPEGHPGPHEDLRPPHPTQSPGHDERPLHDAPSGENPHH